MNICGSIEKPAFGARSQSHLLKLQETFSNNYACAYGVRCEKKGTSYAYLRSHLCSDHPDFERIISDSRDPECQLSHR